MKYRYKAVRSGDVVEIYEYEYHVAVGEPKRRVGPPEPETAKEVNKVAYRKKALQRAGRELRRLVNANIGRHDGKDVFMTLTFVENVQDVKRANYEFKKFRQRLEYELKRKLKYVCVVEFQKRGAVHYHLVLFGLPYIPAKLVHQIWGNGFVKLNLLDDVDNVAAYVTKYMRKSMDDEEDDRLKGLKSYFCSRGLYKPVEKVLDKKEIDRLRAGLSRFRVYEAEFENEYTGCIRYEQYNLKRVRNELERQQKNVFGSVI